MKKFLSVCLGMLLCLMLTACGGSKGETLASDIIVHVEVNPSFDIHVNNDGTIKSVDCLNEDAQNVYAEMDLTGVAYEDGFKQILVAIHDAGFLSEDAKITVDIRQKDTVTYEVSKVTDAVLADFEENVAVVESNVSSEVVEEQQSGGLGGIFSIEQTFTIYDNNTGEMHPIIVGLDANNKVVDVNSKEAFVDDLDVEGAGIYEAVPTFLSAMQENGYLNDGDEILIDVKDEALQTELYRLIAQYELENDVDFWWVAVKDISKPYDVNNGEILKADKVDGIWYETTETYQNGVLRKNVIESEEGDYRYQEEQYNENGVITSYIGEAADGTYYEDEYDANGMPVYQVTASGDGQTKQEQFFESGVLVKQIIVSPDYVRTTLYDANGNIIESTEEYLDEE